MCLQLFVGLVELLQRRRLIVIAALVFLDGIEVLDEIRDVIVIVVGSTRWSLLVLLDGLVGLRKLTEGCERVRAELVENTGDELGELLDLAGTVDSESVRGNRGVN